VGEILALLVPNVVASAAVFALLAWDEARMTEAERARAWPVASRRIAAVLFALLAVPLHFLRTRRSLRGLGLAVAWTFALLVLLSFVDAALDALL
jgi:hypothetical protein